MLIKGWDRGLVDGDYTMDDPEAWGVWADRVADAMPEATLLQLLALSERGTFDGDVEVTTDAE